MHYDDLLSYLGDCGPYQKRIYLLVWFTLMPHAIHVCNVVFLMEEPVSRCAVPDLDNDTYFIQNEAHQRWVNAAMPFDSTTGQYSKCKVFAGHHGQNGSSMHPYSTESTTKCYQWVYDTSKAMNSMLPDLGITCSTDAYRLQFGLSIMCGLLIGSLLGGLFSDYFGRKRTLVLAVLFHVILDIAFAFVTSPYITLGVKFVQTALGLIGHMSKFVLIVELIGPKKRGVAAMATMLSWSLPMCISSFVYYFSQDWKVAELILSAPFFICALLMWFVPESPRWLMVNQRIPEAKRVIRKIAKTNKVALPDHFLESLEILNVDEKQKKAITKHGMFQMFKSKIMIIRLIVLGVNWGIVNISYYGLTLNIGTLTRNNIYTGVLVQGIVETVAFSCCMFASAWLGRKMSYCITMVLGGIACLVAFILGIADADGKGINLALFALGKFGVGAAFTLVYTLTAELIPTASRNFGLGLCSLSGRIFGILAPYIGNMRMVIPGKLGVVSPLLVFGITSILAGISIHLVPETQNQHLQESVIEVEKDTKKVESAEGEVML